MESWRKNEVQENGSLSNLLQTQEHLPDVSPRFGIRYDAILNVMGEAWVLLINIMNAKSIVLLKACLGCSPVVSLYNRIIFT